MVRQADTLVGKQCDEPRHSPENHAHKHAGVAARSTRCDLVYRGDRRPPGSKPSSPSTLLFSEAMDQIMTPKTALATTSATEYPICSPAVAATPEIPIILMMYTKG